MASGLLPACLDSSTVSTHTPHPSHHGREPTPLAVRCCAHTTSGTRSSARPSSPSAAKTSSECARCSRSRASSASCSSFSATRASCPRRCRCAAGLSRVSAGGRTALTACGWPWPVSSRGMVSVRHAATRATHPARAPIRWCRRRRRRRLHRALRALASAPTVTTTGRASLIVTMARSTASSAGPCT